MLARRVAGRPAQRWARTVTHASTGSALSDTPRTDLIAKRIELPPKSSMPATFHAIKHGHPAALLHLRSHHLPLLNLFLHFAACAADALAIPLSRPVMLPRQRRLWTVPRSPFVHKKSQENFERIIHKRVLKAWDTNPQLIDLWEEYLKMHSLAGVGMRIVKWERLPLDIIGDQNRGQLQEARTDARKVAAIGQKIIDTSSDQGSPSAKQDKKLETRTIQGKKSAIEIRKELAQTSGRKGRLSIAERKKLEKQARKEELLRLASEKRAALPDRVEDSLSELDSTVRRALKAIPRYDVIRPAYSAAEDAEAALEHVLERMRIQEREEADLDRQKIEQIRHEMAIPSNSTTQAGEQAKVSLFAARTEDATSSVSPVASETTETAAPKASSTNQKLSEAPTSSPVVSEENGGAKGLSKSKLKHSKAWNTLLSLAAQTGKPKSS